MVTIYYRNDQKIEHDVTPEMLSRMPLSDVIWIDLASPSREEQDEVEKLISIKFPSRQKAEEIETTSKYSETLGKEILINTDYYIDRGKNYESVPVSYIITASGILVSFHPSGLLAFEDVAKRIQMHPKENSGCYGVFLTILESIIDYEADMEELLTREITRLSKVITSSKNIDKAILHRINELQEKSTALREDVYDVVRVLNSLIRSKLFPEDSDGRISLMAKDADSLINHGDISFARLDYLQDTTMGLINIQQNEIVKILSVAAVIFMPPTLIASIYGMNFKVMPELDWVWNMQNGWVVPAGYIFAIFLMVLVTFMTYWFFRYKKWL